MKKIFLILLLPFKWFWKLLTASLSILTTLALLASVTILLTALFYQPEIKVEEGSIFVFSPEGNIVEQRSPVNPLSRVINNLSGVPLKQEVFLQDALDSIYGAADDSRIKAMLLTPEKLRAISLNQAQDIGTALDYFKQSGKKIIAMGNVFSQSQYYLASRADEIYLHPMGSVRLRGFGLYRLYMKDFLDKLAVEFHVFRVGTFKSALEPFTRSDMSPAAEEANMVWLNALWDVYISDIAKQRHIAKRDLQHFIDNLTSYLQYEGGDQAAMALKNKLVDGLKNHNEIIADLKKIAGESLNKQSYKQITYEDYLQTIVPSYTPKPKTSELIGIITASGNIMYGEDKVNQIGSSTLIKKIQQAKYNDKIKALVLRISTGGGSAFASELIRQELLSFKATGKPLVISMGSMAASGGYWLAANADLIVASPVTLTGSIGIFGAVPTIEKSLAKIGVYGDGIGTSQTALFGNPTSEMSSPENSFHQLTVENGYKKFLSIVAEGRNMSFKKVQMIAEGRVWDGATAMRLGLVDKLGSLEQSIEEAARLAGIAAENAVYITSHSTSLENLMQHFDGTMSRIVENVLTSKIIPKDILHLWNHQQKQFTLSSDPGDIYAHCLVPEAIIAF